MVTPTSLARLAVLALVAAISCSPSRPAEPTAPTTTKAAANDLAQSSCPEPMYDARTIVGPATEVRIELHDATSEMLAFTGFCVTLDGRSVFTMDQMKKALDGAGKPTVAWSGPVSKNDKHTIAITIALTGSGSAEISKLKLRLEGERTFNAKDGLVVRIETREEGGAETPLATRAVLHVSPMDP